jgi:hypothetical protein
LLKERVPEAKPLVDDFGRGNIDDGILGALHHIHHSGAAEVDGFGWRGKCGNVKKQEEKDYGACAKHHKIVPTCRCAVKRLMDEKSELERTGRI